MRCAIIDDDEIARTVLKRFIQHHGGLDLAFTSRSGAEARGDLRNTRVDLIFLDVEMPGISGLELLRSLEVRPEVILTTGNPGYAVEAFQLEVVDYLVKPIAFDRFLQATSRVARRLAQAAPPHSVRHIFGTVDGRLTRIDLSRHCASRRTTMWC